MSDMRLLAVQRGHSGGRGMADAGAEGRHWRQREERRPEMFTRDNMGLNPVNVSPAKEGVNGVKGWNRQALEAYQTQGEKRKLAGVEVCSAVDAKIFLQRQHCPECDHRQTEQLNTTLNH